MSKDLSTSTIDEETTTEPITTSTYTMPTLYDFPLIEPNFAEDEHSDYETADDPLEGDEVGNYYLNLLRNLGSLGEVDEPENTFSDYEVAEKEKVEDEEQRAYPIVRKPTETHNPRTVRNYKVELDK